MAEYPLPKFHFEVNWGGTKIGFTEVSGMEVETEVIEYREGASKEYSKLKMPGMRKYSNISLKRGTFKSDNEFFDWFNEVKLNTITRRDITIS
jgi:phage tail-like protein